MLSIVNVIFAFLEGGKMSGKLPNKKIVGAKQTLKAIKQATAKIVYVAKDADKKVTQPIVDLCNENKVELVVVETMEELGRLCGIDVGASAACILKD